MRLVLRVLGTWLLGMALILVIVDGTKTLAANSLVITSLNEVWGWFGIGSLDALRGFFDSRLFGPLLDPTLDFLLTCPAWAVLAVPGIVLAWLGRSRRTRVFVQQDRI